MIELDEDLEPQDPKPVAQPSPESLEFIRSQQPQEPRTAAAPTEPSEPSPESLEFVRQAGARAENDFLTMFGVASETDPTRFAEARDIAKTLNIDPDTALENRDVLRAVWKKRQLENADLARTAPVLAKTLMNAEFARIAHDDVADLGFFEGLWRSWSAGQAETMLGKVGTERMFRGEQPELLAQARNLRRELRHSPPAEGWVWGLARWGGQMSVMIPEAVTYGAAAGATAAGLAGAISGPAAPAAVPAAAAGAFAATFATSMFAQSFQLQGGLDYDEFIRAGYDPQTSFHAAVGSGLVGATLETAGVALQWARPVMQPLKRALAREVGEALVQQTLTKAGLQAGKSYLLGVAGEVTTESLQELTSMFAENIAYKASQNPEADPSTYAKGETWKRLVDVAVSSAQLSMVLGAMPEYARYRYLAMNAERAKQTYQTLQQSMETVANSKTMERAPDLATAYLAETLAESKAETLHIDGAAFVKALSQTDKESTESGAVEKSAIEQLSNAFPEIAGQISDAATNGTDVTIPTAVFIEKLSKTTLGAKLVEHARTDAGAPSWAEVQEGVENAPELVQQLSADIDKRADEAEKFAESASDLEKRIRDEIRASGKIKNNRVADTAAFVARKYYETQAAEQGKLPSELPQISFTGKPVPESALQQPGRGAFDPNTNTIHLTEKSDASTLWHEMLHSFFSMMVADPAPTPRVQADLDALFRWFGTDRAGWDAMSQEQREKLHEQLAYSHEVYGYEGKAPSTELQPVFDRMSRWIRDIYKDVNGSLNAAYKKEFGVDLPVLTDEVRRVFGSMLAAQDAIEQAAAVQGQTATFTERSQFSGTEEQWNEYRALEEARRLGGVSKLTSEMLANIKWLDTRSKAISKEVAAVAKKARTEARKAAEKQVKQEPVYKLRQWLKQGRHTIDRGEAARALGVLAQDRMPGLAPYLSDDGALPDVVAEQQGFTTGEEMLTALADAPELDAAIEARTDELVLQEHGNLQNATDQAVAIQEALNSEAASKLAGFLLKFALGEKRQGRLSRAAIKEAARQRLENTSLRKIDSAAYARAAAKAEREASELLRGKAAFGGREAGVDKRGRAYSASAPKAAVAPNPKEAIAKLQQWALNTELARQAAKIQKEVNEAKTRAKRFFRPNEKLAKSHVMNLINAGRAILTAYGIAGGAKLPLSFINQIEQYDPVAYDRIAPLVAEITNNDTLQDYRDLTPEQFRDVIGVTDSLWDGSVRDKHIEVGGKKVLREAAETEMLTAAVAALGPTPTQVGPVSEQERKALSWSGMKAYVLRVESWAKKLDGGAASGPWQNYIYRQMSNPFTRYMRDRERLVRKMHDLLLKTPMPEGTIDGSSTIGHIFPNMAELLGALLHTGNQSSLRKLLLGYEWGTESVASGAPVLDRSRWDDFIQEQIAKGKLKKEHFDFVQAMWDLNEELKPIAQKVNKDIYGVYFKDIEAQSFETPWGTYRGGYAPAPPDRAHPKNGNMGLRIEADFLRAMENDFRESMPGVNESFTIERNASTRPLLLDVRLQARHFDQVLRFIHLQQPARDVMKLLNSEKMAAYLAKAQPGVVEQVLVPWLKAVTANRMTTPHESGMLNTLFSTLRRSTGLSFMFFSVRNALQQATGLFNSLVQVKRKHLAAGFWRYHEMGLEKTIESISQDSVFMQERLQSQLGQLSDDIDLMLDPSRWGRAKQAINKHGYFLQRMVQNRVDVVTWLGARDQAMATHGNAELAVQEADSAVRLSQGSHTTVDVAKYERSSPFARLFFQFSGYYNTVLNQILVAKGWQQKAKTALLASLAPALASAAIGLGLSLGTEMDDNDEDGYGDEFAWWLGSNVLKAGANMVPGFGPAVAQTFTSEKVAGDRVTLAPAAAVLQAAARLVGVFEYQPKRPGAAQIELLGQRFRAGGSQIRDLGLVISAVTGIPIGFLAKPLAYWRDVATGETEATPLRTAANILGTGR